MQYGQFWGHLHVVRIKWLCFNIEHSLEGFLEISSGFIERFNRRKRMEEWEMRIGWRSTKRETKKHNRFYKLFSSQSFLFNRIVGAFNHLVRFGVLIYILDCFFEFHWMENSFLLPLCCFFFSLLIWQLLLRLLWFFPQKRIGEFWFRSVLNFFSSSMQLCYFEAYAYVYLSC